MFDQAELDGNIDRSERAQWHKQDQVLWDEGPEEKAILAAGECFFLALKASPGRRPDCANQRGARSRASLPFLPEN